VYAKSAASSVNYDTPGRAGGKVSPAPSGIV
jgi:hypothetical protein